ncbi:MAG: RNase A-like domain-containing protein [Anaerolineaceae bacterium]
MTSRLKTYVPIVVVGLLLVGAYLYANYWRDSSPDNAKADDAAQATADAKDAGSPGTARATATARAPAARTAQASANAEHHDLQSDEESGGHTLSRHVGKTDDELRARLDRESDISAASTYTDRASAERSVAAALSKGKQQLTTWENGTSKQNLVLRVTMPNTIGLSLRRGDTRVKSVNSAVVVLTKSGGDWFVLTSYPEDR